MKGIKKMLLGIAFLIAAAMGTVFWMSGSAVGAVMFILGLVIGVFLCIDGYLNTDDKNN